MLSGPNGSAEVLVSDCHLFHICDIGIRTVICLGDIAVNVHRIIPFFSIICIRAGDMLQDYINNGRRILKVIAALTEYGE